jgi:hypothetical protein
MVYIILMLLKKNPVRVLKLNGISYNVVMHEKLHNSLFMSTEINCLHTLHPV